MTVRALVVGAAAAVVTATAMLLGTLEPYELDALNYLFELRGPRAPVAPVVIVGIDEDSFDELNLAWPFPRSLHGTLVDRISAGRPLVIAFDIIFSEPSPYGADDDEAFGAAIGRAGNVVLGAAITTVVEAFYVKTDFNLPVPVVRAGAAAVGPVNHATDPDGNLRRVLLRHSAGDETVDAWDVHVYRLAQARGVRVAPLPEEGEIVINYRGGPRTFPWVPYHRVVNGEVPPETFRDRIVLIGATTPVLQDIFSTPFAEARAMPGVEVHANVLDTLIAGDSVRPVPVWAAVAIAAAVAVGAGYLAGQLRAVRAFVAVALIWCLIAAWTVVGFAVFNAWLRAVGITLGLVLGYGATVIDGYIREQREKRRLSQFFSPAVLREIVEHSREAALSSSRRVVTVLFSDIRGFTSISERVAPELVAEMLREYLTEMTDVVFRYRGTVDKYIGDCIMALYNAPFEDPEHAANAIRTGLDLQERTLAVAARWRERLGVEIRNGVGINTGEAVVGTMGSRQRLEYTAIGDTVNLAARLESLTKDYGHGIVISEYTYALVRGQFLTRELGEVAVKGKSQPVKIYAVLPGDIRKYPRVALDAAAVITAGDAGERYEVRTRDVSEGGLSVIGLPSQWGPGTVLQIRCEGGALPAPILAEGTIVWRQGDLAGIAFRAFEPDVAPVLAGFIASRRRP